MFGPYVITKSLEQCLDLVGGVPVGIERPKIGTQEGSQNLLDLASERFLIGAVNDMKLRNELCERVVMDPSQRRIGLLKPLIDGGQLWPFVADFLSILSIRSFKSSKLVDSVF